MRERERGRGGERERKRERERGEREKEREREFLLKPCSTGRSGGGSVVKIDTSEDSDGKSQQAKLQRRGSIAKVTRTRELGQGKDSD